MASYYLNKNSQVILKANSTKNPKLKIFPEGLTREAERFPKTKPKVSKIHSGLVIPRIVSLEQHAVKHGLISIGKSVTGPLCNAC